MRETPPRSLESVSMNELQQVTAQADRLDSETDKLFRQIEHIESADSPATEALDLALSQSKRVQREGRLLTRALAILRDNLQPGGTR